MRLSNLLILSSIFGGSLFYFEVFDIFDSILTSSVCSSSYYIDCSISSSSYIDCSIGYSMIGLGDSLYLGVLLIIKLFGSIWDFGFEPRLELMNELLGSSHGDS